VVERRRRKSILELLAVAPWPINAGLALVVFISAKYFAPLVHFESPVLAAGNVLARMAEQHAHYVALPFVVLTVVAAANRIFRQRLLDRQGSLESIRALSWQDFELLVGEAFRREGYAVAENGGGGADGGVDLKLYRDGKTIVVQCKSWKTHKVGVSAIRELFGVMVAERADGAYFVSSGTFSSDAIEFAVGNGMSLIDGVALADFIGVAQAARKGVDLRPAFEGNPPSCPNCSQVMIMRAAKRGDNAGQKFWGCSSYPRCRGTRNVAIVSSL
jgi:restriction system protein